MQIAKNLKNPERFMLFSVWTLARLWCRLGQDCLVHRRKRNPSFIYCYCGGYWTTGYLSSRESQSSNQI